VAASLPFAIFDEIDVESLTGIVPLNLWALDICVEGELIQSPIRSLNGFPVSFSLSRMTASGFKSPTNRSVKGADKFGPSDAARGRSMLAVEYGRWWLELPRRAVRATISLD
jgi:hypothetical protein